MWVEMGVCLPVPSRLKGMETPLGNLCCGYLIGTSACAFPLEGNGNSFKFLAPFSREAIQSECAFPLEGNGNRTVKKQKRRPIQCLNVPSRLKGMETQLYQSKLYRQVFSSLPVPSRLKGMETSLNLTLS